MKLHEIRIRNIKKLVAVDIKPDGSVINITGKNEMGKTTVIDSIYMALKGGKSLPDKPVRDGAKKGSIFLDIGDYTIEKNIAKGKATLKVKPKKGTLGQTQQAFLNDLFAGVGFNPLTFINANVFTSNCTITATM